MSMLQDKFSFTSLRIGTLFCLYLGFVCISCSEPTEGCIDALASNFELEADIDCCLIEQECCCNYPILDLNLFYKGRAEDALSDPTTNIDLSLIHI